MPAAVVRRSARATSIPSRFKPANDMPSDLQDLIHTAAASAVSKSSHPFEAVSICSAIACGGIRPDCLSAFPRVSQDAVVALEEALEPMLEALCAAALEHAQRNGRDSILEADLAAVSKDFMSTK